MSISVLNTDAGLSGKTITNLEDAQTVTGLKTFDRDPNAPFAVSSGSAVVSNLDADKLDGVEGANYVRTDQSTTITAGFLTHNTQPRARAYNNATQSLNDSTWTSLTLNTEDYDVTTLHDTGSNTSRMTVPASGGGVYLIIGGTTFAASATGVRGVRIAKNGSVVGREMVVGNNGAGTATKAQIIAVEVLAAADYIEVQGFQNSGGALNAGSATRADASELTIVRLW